MAATGSAQSFVVSKATPGVTLTSSQNPSTYTTPVTFTATVPVGVSGTIIFYDGGALLGSATITGTSAMLATNALNAGNHSITAQYGGDSNDNSSASGSLLQVVNQSSLTVNGSSTLNPSLYGDSVTFTFDFSGSGAIPTGSATITLDGTVVPTPITLDGNGKATYTTSALAAGIIHNIVATYNGSTDYY